MTPPRTSIRAAVTTTVLLSLALASAAPSWAQDVEPEDPEPTVSVFGLGELGLGGSVPVGGGSGTGGSTQLTLPVPDGTAASFLNATVTVPAWLDRGWIDVESGGIPMSRIDLVGDAPTVPMSIPLTAATVVDDSVTLDLSSTLVPDAGYCPGVREAPVRLVNAAVEYAGVPAIPRTIAEFLPSVLRQLTVFVPAEPDSDITAAALNLTTSVIDYYGSQTVQVIVRPDSELQGAAPDGPFDRSVVLAENSDAGTELVFPIEQAPPRLFVTGTGGELVDQARLVTSTLADLALTTSVFAGVSGPPPVVAPDSITLDDLEVGTITGSGTASLALDQSRLGRSAAGVSVHLIGSYTPGAGSVTATVGDRTLDVWAADDSGVLDHWIDIPNDELNRVSTLDVTVAHPSGAASVCDGNVPQVTIDGTTVVESADSSTPAPLGFGSMPQALMPRVNVALAENSFANVVRAVSILDGLQRMSARQLNVAVVPVDDAIAGTDPALIVDPDGIVDLSLPLSSEGATTFSTVTAEGSTDVLTLDSALPYASIQVAATDGDAAMLVASSREAPAELDRLLGWLGADPTRWYGLTGDVLLCAAGLEPVSLTSDDLAGPEDSLPADESSHSTAIVAVGIGIGLLVLGIVAAVVIRTRSRRTRAS